MKIQKEFIIKPQGKFGALTPLEDITDYLNTVENTKSEVVVLDLSDTSFIDSSGISILIKMHKLCKKQNKYFSVNNCNKQIKDLLRILKLDRKIPIN